MNKNFSFLFVLGLGIIAVSTIVYGWTGPTATPPDGNVDAPINVGSSVQKKIGSFSLGGDLRNQNIKFDVIGAGMFNDLFTGTLQISGGTGAGTRGKVLVASNDNGLVEWVSTSTIFSPVTSSNNNGVNRIIAGNGISISPTSGTGTVTVSRGNTVPTYVTCSSNGEASCTASCSAGKYVTGGGCDINMGQNSIYDSGIISSRPTSNRTGWYCQSYTTEGSVFPMTGYAICI